MILLIILPSLLITQDNGNIPEEPRYGVFLTRKGNCEIGRAVEERMYFNSTPEPRETVGTNNLLLIKKDSKGELLIVEGETIFFEMTTFYIDLFTNYELITALYHGLMEMNLSNVTDNYPISIETEAIIVKTKKNTVFRMRNDRKTYTSGVLVKSGYVWVFDRINEDQCVIIKEGQSIILGENQTLYEAKMPDGIEIMDGCIEKFQSGDFNVNDNGETSSQFNIDVKTYEHEGDEYSDDTSNNNTNDQDYNDNDNDDENDDEDNDDIEDDEDGNDDDEDETNEGND